MDIECLLAEQGWLNRLARRLVGDANLADDLTQTTVARAVEHPPRMDRPVRGWLATVLRRESARLHRRDSERSAREERLAGDGLAPATDLLTERVGTQRELARLVLERPPGQREVLLLSFWEGLPPRSIARRLELDIEAVKSRKACGLESLRQRLDRAHVGDRGVWVLALGPLAHPGLTHLGPGAPGAGRTLEIAPVGLVQAFCDSDQLEAGRNAKDELYRALISVCEVLRPCEVAVPEQPDRPKPRLAGQVDRGVEVLEGSLAARPVARPVPQVEQPTRLGQADDERGVAHSPL